MIGVVFLLSAFAALGESFITANVAASVVIGLLLSIYVCFLLLDCRRVCSWVDARPSDQEKLKTSLGAALGDRVATLLESLKSYSWQSEQVRALANGVKSDRLFKELISESNWRAEGVSSLASRAVRYARARSRCGGIGIRIVSCLETDATALLGPDSERFNALLKHVHARLTQKLSIDEDLEAFHAFGYSRSLIQRCGDNTGDAGMIWFGYINALPPSSSDEKFTQELAVAITEELRYAERLRNVSKPDASENEPHGEELVKFSHDIRSPLNNIKAILALLKLETLRTESAELLDVALSNCRGVEAVVEDVIDFSRHRAGKLSQRIEIIELRELLEEILERNRVAARMKGLRIALECSRTPAAVIADRNQVRRIFTNLISNALKYTRFGSVTISLRRSLGDKLLVSIRDTGIGMTPDQLADLFTPFTRFNNGEIDGVGLGLSIVKILVEGNAGKIEARSKLGEGSEFIVHLPAHAGDARADTNVSQISRGRGAVTGRILLVDDDADLVRSLAKLLERDGFSVLQCITVQDALAAMNFDPPDLVISDAGMPEGGGKRILNALASAKSSIPAVILSGDSSRAHELKALGATAVIEKPCNYDQLKNVVTELLRPVSTAATA